jgi:hypothetical protein
MHTIGPVLKGQDLLVAMKLAVTNDERWTFPALGRALGLSPSETRYSLLRAARAELVSERTRTAIRPNLREFLLHGARYAFPAERGRRSRGMATSTSAPPLLERFSDSADSLVWKFAQGNARGEAVTPIYSSVPIAAGQDPRLYALLVLLDGIRLGGARIRSLATELLARELA